MMKNQDRATVKELSRALSEAPETVSTVGKLNQYALMRRALKAIQKGKFAYTF